MNRQTCLICMRWLVIVEIVCLSFLLAQQSAKIHYDIPKTINASVKHPNLGKTFTAFTTMSSRSLTKEELITKMKNQAKYELVYVHNIATCVYYQKVEQATELIEKIWSGNQTMKKKIELITQVGIVGQRVRIDGETIGVVMHVAKN